MKVYTKTGDAGQTSLLSRQRVWKDDVRVDAYGTVDEANSAMGLAKSLLTCAKTEAMLQRIQVELIDLNADLATDLPENEAVYRISQTHVANLERWIDELEKQRIPQKYFVTPGGCPASAALDLARTIVRRAERCTVRLHRSKAVPEMVALYLNRLSDFLFVLARCVEQQDLVAKVTAGVRRALQDKQAGRGCRAGRVLERAKRIMEAAEYKALEIGVPMVMSVVDEGGNPVAQQRMDGSLLASIALSLDKAYTAAALKMSTEQAAELAVPGKPLYGLHTAAGGRLIVFGGGVPIRESGMVVGGFGVSGGLVQEDVLVAKAGLTALQ
ncbi:hypothetical protein P22_0388 [Propionispora sp. 2/2-37]|uniref:cob(I)yrinic acid a,c-diamide adenosyltransferase n=1 Tax=Propionispora sp. 2/2-37 TaxID=1677858 RepID=UPI0006BB7AA6|nr:cob(I)yrinic acid a,c-diamide adenosyltransferase [Propionispora sp. 2/2-37]CUH94322.1 hypothetical protein P22_0388 [Propionispora sp. 2/2-37]